MNSLDLLDAFAQLVFLTVALIFVLVGAESFREMWSAKRLDRRIGEIGRDQKIGRHEWITRDLLADRRR